MPAILLVKQTDAPVAESPGRWKAGEIVAVFEADHVFDRAEFPTAGNFYKVLVTDKTKAQVEAYQEQWRHQPALSVVASNPPNYRIRLESPRASVSGKGALVREELEQMLTDLASLIEGSATYHDHGRVGNTVFFEFNVLGVDANERDAARDFVEERIRTLSIKRRRWAINGAGMTVLENNGGTVSATAAQVQNYLTDGLTE